MFLDNLNLIVTKSGDGGDTAQNEGFLAITQSYTDSYYLRAINILEPKKDGIWVRHPIQYPDTNDFTRDQTTSNLIALGLLDHKDFLNRLVKAQIKRFGLYQDKSLPGPDNIGQFIRALNFKLLYPLLWFTDMFMFINTLLICFIKAKEPNALQIFLGKHIHWIFVQGEPNNAQGIPQDTYGKNNVGTDKNQIASLYQAQKTMPTLISFIARKIYKHFRPNGPQYALDIYYKIDNHEIAESWYNLLKEF